jgi:hypothetical protein
MVRTPGAGETVLVAPITHTDPGDPAISVEITAADAAGLGLDDRTSWIIIDIDELNYFIWIGYDVEPDRVTGQYEICMLQSNLRREAQSKFAELRRLRKIKAVPRDEKTATSTAKNNA